MNHKSGYVAILGLPNVGKSTLLNALLGQKIAITNKKPQTTRKKILGILSDKNYQIIFLDTPGILSPSYLLQEKMMREVALSVHDADIILLLIDVKKDPVGYETFNQKFLADILDKGKRKIVLLLNKIDLIKNKHKLLPQLSKIQGLVPRAEIVPVSATTGENVDRLESLVETALPQSPYYFPDDQITDRSERFLVAEIIREKLMRQLGDEIPYALTIQIERCARKKKTTQIDATIFVEREGQKAILIGSKGEKLKRIGSDARSDIERLLETKVMLTTWVKVKAGWSNDDRALKSLGYEDV
ncbi:MAG: GTPase Era [Bacteroidetes bacterium]|nr:GTPase Era [Bacteroidota bacterium]